MRDEPQSDATAAPGATTEVNQGADTTAVSDANETTAASERAETAKAIRPRIPTTAARLAREKRQARYARDFALFMAVVCILVAGFAWAIIEAITVFGFILWVAPVVLLLFVISLKWSASVLEDATQKRESGAAWPIAINIATILVVLFFPFTRLWLDYDFWRYRADREAVVTAIHSGQIVCNTRLYHLPETYPNLSSGGNDIVIRPYGEDGDAFYVFFYTFRGILDNYSGFLYIPPKPGASIKDYEGPAWDAFFAVRPMAPNWYYVAHK